MNYNIPIKVFPDASETVDLLSDAEAGRLFKSLLHYINGTNDELPGKEMLVYTMLKKQYDRDVAGYQDYLDTQRENGKKGGRPKKPMGFSENPNNPRVFNPQKKTLEVEVDVDHEEEHDHDNDHEVDVDHDRARELSAAPAFDSPDFKADLTSPITYAVNELGHLSPLDMQALESFRDDLPDDVIIYGINAACSANVRTWAYARSILNRYVQSGYKSVGDIKADEAKREAAKANAVSDGGGGRVQNPTLNYQQRSNEEYEKPIENDWMKEYMPKGGA